MRVLAALVLLILLAIVSTTITYYHFQPDVQKLPITIHAGTEISFDLAKDKLSMGGVPPGSAAWRTVIITADKKKRFWTYVEGDVAPYTTVTPAKGFVENQTELNVSVLLPPDIEALTGTLVVYTR